jgi:hypothetical protein
MSTIEIDSQEASALLETLDSVVSDLGYEIASTDAKDFRDRPKEKRARLQRVMEALGAD